MSLDADSLLGAIESHPASIRDGADSLVALYWWRRAGGEPAGFVAAIQALVADRRIEILPGPDMRLRLTAEAFALLDERLPAAPDSDSMSPSEADNETAWNSSVGGARETPVGELVAHLLKIFTLLQKPAGHPVAAGTLSKIWALERRRGGDLRMALDTLAASGDLRIQRGSRTTFALTETGAMRIQASA